MPQAPAGVIALRDLAYVENDHERQKLDLYLPEEGENYPLIIWIHGDVLHMGSKEGDEHASCPSATSSRATRWRRSTTA